MRENGGVQQQAPGLPSKINGVASQLADSAITAYLTTKK